MNICELSWRKRDLNDGLLFLEEAGCPLSGRKMLPSAAINSNNFAYKIITSPGKNVTIKRRGGERDRARQSETERERDRASGQLGFHIWPLEKVEKANSPQTPGSAPPPESQCHTWLLSNRHILHVSNA